MSSTGFNIKSENAGRGVCEIRWVDWFFMRWVKGKEGGDRKGKMGGYYGMIGGLVWISGWDRMIVI